jgi:uncharacterized protein (DUF2147 family)
MKKKLLLLTAVILCVAFSAAGWAAEPSIVGVWSVPIVKGTDKGKERSQMEIFEKDGVYYGKIVKLNFVPTDTLCTKCKKDKKDKPLMGMVILRNLKKEADRYGGGKILEAENGEEYDCSIVLISRDKMKMTAGWLFLTQDHYLTRVK